MDLKTGKMFWSDTYKEAPNYPELTENIDCDVCIVGSGSSGAHCAYFLAETGLNVVLVDKRDIGAGSTMANTGLLQYTNDKTLTSYIHSFGENAGVRHVQLCLEAMNAIRTYSDSKFGWRFRFSKKTKSLFCVQSRRRAHVEGRIPNSKKTRISG